MLIRWLSLGVSRRRQLRGMHRYGRYICDDLTEVCLRWECSVVVVGSFNVGTNPYWWADKEMMAVCVLFSSLKRIFCRRPSWTV